jgi:alpha-maltose-1-phosphate synthase
MPPSPVELVVKWSIPYMSDLQKTSEHKIVGVIGSGQVGIAPFDRQSWSGCSYFFFTECQRQGLLHRAFGVEVPRLKRYLLMASDYSLNRRLWRTRYYMNPRYRDALTEETRRNLQQEDFGYSFLQIGAMFNVPSLVGNKTPCFSYHDGNMAQSLRSPYAVQGLSAQDIDRGLAYEKQVYLQLTRIFTMSEYLRQSFITDFDVPPGKVVSIGAGINLERIPEYFPDKKYDERNILFIGVDFARKGGWQLLEAFRQVRQKFSDATLHIVGPPQLNIPPKLQSGVIYHGFLRKQDPVDGPKLTQLFRDCSLFVMPSLFEPFGIAPLEAMVHQLPCVVTNRWALKEMVTPGETGELVECGSAEDIAVKIIQLFSHPQQLRQMGETGRELVLNEYRWEKVVARMKANIQESATAQI